MNNLPNKKETGAKFISLRNFRIIRTWLNGVTVNRKPSVSLFVTLINILMNGISYSKLELNDVPSHRGFDRFSGKLQRSFVKRDLRFGSVEFSRKIVSKVVECETNRAIQFYFRVVSGAELYSTLVATIFWKNSLTSKNLRQFRSLPASLTLYEQFVAVSHPVYIYIRILTVTRTTIAE